MTGTGQPRCGIACAGNWILDIVHDIPLWPEEADLVCISAQTSGLGGGAANVSADLVALDGGYPVYPIGLIGNDRLGSEVRSKIIEAGLATDRIAVLAGESTAHTHVMNVTGKSRTFFYHPGTNAVLSRAQIDLDDFARNTCKLFYLGYLNLLPGSRSDRRGWAHGGLSPATGRTAGRSAHLRGSGVDRYGRLSRRCHRHPARD